MAAPQSYNFFGMGPGQMAPGQDQSTLAQQMQLQQYNNPTSSQAQGGSSMPSTDPKALGKMLQSQQYAPGYTDSAGVSGQTLAANGIAPGAGSNGPMGLGGLSMFGGAGNPLDLSSGNQFSPADLAKIQGAFSNG